MSLPCFFLQGCSFSDAVYLTEGELFAFETLRKTERELTHEWSVVQDTACQASVEREVVRGGGSRFHPLLSAPTTDNHLGGDLEPPSGPDDR